MQIMNKTFLSNYDFIKLTNVSITLYSSKAWNLFFWLKTCKNYASFYGNALKNFLTEPSTTTVEPTQSIMLPGDNENRQENNENDGENDATVNIDESQTTGTGSIDERHTTVNTDESQTTKYTDESQTAGNTDESQTAVNSDESQTAIFTNESQTAINIDESQTTMDADKTNRESSGIRNCIPTKPLHLFTLYNEMCVSNLIFKKLEFNLNKLYNRKCCKIYYRKMIYVKVELNSIF